MVSKTSLLSSEPLTFSIELDENDDRIDCAWFDPVAKEKINSLRQKNVDNRKLVSLKAVSDVNYGKRLPPGTVIVEDEASVIPFIRGGDVKHLRVNWEDSVKLPKEIHQVIQNSQIKQNDIVITIVGTIGEAGILQDDIEVCDVSDNLARIHVSDPNLLPEFLLYQLNSEYVKIQTNRFSVGSLQYKLSMQSCRNIDVYIPFNKQSNVYDLQEQQRILDKVHTILGEAQSERRKGLDLIKRSKAVVLEKLGIALPVPTGGTDIFEQDLGENGEMRLDALFNNPYRYKLIESLKGHNYELLGTLTKKPVMAKMLPSDFYRLVELEEVDENIGEITGARDVSELGSEKITLTANTVLISKLQPEKGKVAIVSELYDGCAASSELIPLQVDSESLSLQYLWALLRSDYVLKQWAYTLTGSSRMRIGQQEISDTVVPVPEPKIQAEIVAAVNSRIDEGRRALNNSSSLQLEAQKSFSELLFAAR